MHVYFPLSVLWTSIHFLRLNLRSIRFSLWIIPDSAYLHSCLVRSPLAQTCVILMVMQVVTAAATATATAISTSQGIPEATTPCTPYWVMLHPTSCHKIWDFFLTASAWESSRLNRCSTCTPGNDRGLLLMVANFDQWYIRTNRNVCLPFFSLCSMDHS